jgi:hypothetical protein
MFIFIDGPLSAGNGGELGWMSAIATHHNRFEAFGRIPDRPGYRAVHEYEILAERSKDGEQQARWVRLLRIEPIPIGHGTTRGIPEYEALEDLE